MLSIVIYAMGLPRWGMETVRSCPTLQLTHCSFFYGITHIVSLSASIVAASLLPALPYDAYDVLWFSLTAHKIGLGNAILTVLCLVGTMVVPISAAWSGTRVWGTMLMLLSDASLSGVIAVR